jgi:hypothetical protein
MRRGLKDVGCREQTVDLDRANRIYNSYALGKNPSLPLILLVAFSSDNDIFYDSGVVYWKLPKPRSYLEYIF